MSIRRRDGLASALAAAAIAVAWLGCGSPQSTGTTIELPTFASLEAARGDAAERSVPVLVDFYTDW